MLDHCEEVEWPSFFLVPALLTGACNIIASVGCVYVMVCILRDQDLRKNTLNLYVAFMLFPDSINTLMTFFTVFFRLLNCGEINQLFINALDFTTFFYYMCNFSLNSVVAWELSLLLEQSRRFSKMAYPPMKRTWWKIFCAYSFALLFAIWGIVDFSWSWWWRHTNSFGSPQPGGLFTETASISMVGGLMLGFIIFVIAIRIRIWWKKLMPKRGRSKKLSNFFQRIIVVFLGFYFPTLALHLTITTVGGHSVKSHKKFWIEQTIFFLTALQALVTLAVVSQKPDIKASVLFSRRQERLTRRSSTLGESSTFHNFGRSSLFHNSETPFIFRSMSMFFQKRRTNLSASDHAGVVVALGDDDAEGQKEEQNTSTVMFAEPKERSTGDQIRDTLPVVDADASGDLSELVVYHRGILKAREGKSKTSAASEWEMSDEYEVEDIDIVSEEEPARRTNESLPVASEIISTGEARNEIANAHDTTEPSPVLSTKTLELPSNKSVPTLSTDLWIRCTSVHEIKDNNAVDVENGASIH